MAENTYKCSDLTGRIIGCAMQAFGKLGNGFILGHEALILSASQIENSKYHHN
jgi:hypothetical protein